MKSREGEQLLVFGPQALSFPTDTLHELRDIVLDRLHWTWLTDVLDTLPRFWDAFIQSQPDARDAIPERKTVEDLALWLRHGHPYGFDGDEIPNIVLTPLVVLVHLVQYGQWVKLQSPGAGADRHLADRDAFADWAAQSKGHTKTLGFCTGLLSAYAVACSHDRGEFERYGAVALRLAMLVGACVDIRDARTRETDHGRPKSFVAAWKPDQEQQINRMINQFHPAAYASVVYDDNRATVTSPEHLAARMQEQLRTAGAVIADVNLKGRFHDPDSVAMQEAEALIDFCDQTDGLRLPDSKRLALQTYGNSTQAINLPAAGSRLHAVALRAILAEQCDWRAAFATAASACLEGEGHVVSFSLDRCIAPSLARRLGSRLTNIVDVRLSQSPLLIQRTGSELPESQPAPAGGRTSASTGAHEAPHVDDDAIAIVGMAIKVAGADDPNEFAAMLQTGESQHEPVGSDRMMPDTLFRDQSKGSQRGWNSNAIRDVDAFDHTFFRRSHHEAESMDPQQRLFLQAAHQAVESSAYFSRPPSTPSDRHIGVYAGVCAVDYEQHTAGSEPSPHAATGTARAAITANVSRHFGWTGPSITFDTACSASTVAVHAACRDLLAGDCSAALAGGVSTISNVLWFQNLGAASFLSPTGQCRPFDSGADGYCRAEGIGCVLLRRLRDARARGDPILACIAASAVYQNRNHTPLFVPNAPSLTCLLRDVVRKAGLRPEHISLVEAHGTGTPVGDPAEYQSISAALGCATRTRPVVLGSVKGHVGHTEGASGVISLIKVVMMMQGGFIPPQASFLQMSPEIAPSSDVMEVATCLRPWDDPFKAALINNYGASGSNASMVITQAPATEGSTGSREDDVTDRYPLWISGHDDESIRGYCAKLSEYLRSFPDTDLSTLSSNLGRKLDRSLPKRLVFGCGSLQEMQAKLDSITSESPSHTGNLEIQNRATDHAPVILCFGGQVSTFVGLDRGLYDRVAILRHHLDRCNAEIEALGLDSIYPDVFSCAPVRDVVHLQTMLFAVQYSCALAWIDCGLSGKVEAVVGHSFGEITALAVSGTLSLRDTIKLVSSRARLIRDRWGDDRGGMIAVEGDELLVRQLVSDANHRYTGMFPAGIACYNGPRSFTLSGSTEVVDELLRLLATVQRYQAMKSKKLNVSHAFHSSLVEPLMDDLTALGKDVTHQNAIVPLEHAVSTESGVALSASFAADHLRKPVYFNHAIHRLAAKYPSAVFLEAGFNSTVTGMASRAMAGQTDAHFQALNITDGKGLAGLTKTTLALWRQGLPVAFWPHHTREGSEGANLILPPYQFTKHRHWLRLKSPKEALPESASTDTQEIDEQPKGLWTAIKGQDADRPSFRINTTSQKYQSFVSGHTIAQTAPICPATLEIDMAIEALFSLHPEWKDAGIQPVIYDMVNHSPLCVNPALEVYLNFERLADDGMSWQWNITSTHNGKRQTHVTAHLRLRSSTDASYQAEFSRFGRSVNHARCRELLSIARDPDLSSPSSPVDVLHGASVYRALRDVVDYGTLYRGVRTAVGQGTESAGRVALRHAHDTWLDVPLSDAFCQVGGLWVNCMGGDARRGSEEMWLATGCEVYMRAPRASEGGMTAATWDVYARHTPGASEKEYITDLFAFDGESGELTEVIMGIRYAKVAKASMSKILKRLSSVDASAGVTTEDESGVVVPKPEPSATSESSTLPLPEQKSAGPILKLNGANLPTQTQAGRRDLTEEVRKLVADVTGLEPEGIGPDAELVDLGIDSLMGMEVAREVEEVFKCKLDQVKMMMATSLSKFVALISDTLFGPASCAASVSDLDTAGSCSVLESDAWSSSDDHTEVTHTTRASSIAHPTSHTESPASSAPDKNEERRARAERYVREYTADWETQPPATIAPQTPREDLHGDVVLVTGATGSLGSHLAATLAERADVSVVVCINRRGGDSPEDRQDQAFATRGLTLSPPARAKLRILESDTPRPHLGLPPDEYSWLLLHVTHVIHNAWPMSATRALPSFEPQFRALRNLLDLSRDAAAPRVSFQLVSSIGVVGASPNGRVPEPPAPPRDLDAVLPNGYCEAKWVCERILAATLARHPRRFRAMTVRPGQIAGARATGYWNPVEHFAFVVKSAQALGAWPALTGRLRWVPVDACAGTMVELLLRRGEPCPVYHVDHPVGQDWGDMGATLAGELGIRGDRVVGFAEWIAMVRRSGLPEAENPAARLVGFLESNFERVSCGGLWLDTELARRHSETLAGLGPVTAEEARRYVRSWKAMGFLRA